MTIFVVGSGGFIGQALKGNRLCDSWGFKEGRLALSDASWMSQADLVINCAYDNRLKSQEYDEAYDVDLHLARALKAASPRAHYMMLSSRTVYGLQQEERAFQETSVLSPANFYARAKVETEKRLQDILPEQLTILRLSNIFGDEAQPGRRSFLGMALEKLKAENCILFDMSPFVERDFLPAPTLASWIVKIAKSPRKSGVYNIGAGKSVPVGRIAQALIKGYGQGGLMISDMREFDGFSLDISKACAAFGFSPLGAEDIYDFCFRIGQSHS